MQTFYIGEDAGSALLDYVEAHQLRHLVLVADDNTYKALGERVALGLAAAGVVVEIAWVVGPHPAVADERRLIHVLLAAAPGEATFLAVGSGVVTDIARFASYHSRSRFISMPTAASMDGYATSNNTLTVDGLKVSVPGHAPDAIFCDLPTLLAAPRAMSAAGLGDTLAKFTSVNDLRLGHLLWGERALTWERDEPIADRMERLAQTALMRGGEIAAGEPKALAFLMRGLLDSGVAMANFGNSMPGAGSEHHISHCWEMRALLSDERASSAGHDLLHGAKVGVGTVMAAQWYATIRHMTQREAANRLSEARPPDPADEMKAIRRVYGRVADDIIAAQQPFLNMSEEQFGALKRRILDQWTEVQAIAARVPPPEALADALRAAGGPGSARELGLSPEETEIGARYGHFTRPRFTVAKLRLLLGL